MRTLSSGEMHANARRTRANRRRQPSHALFGAFLRGMRAQIAGTLMSVSRGCGRSPGWLSRYERGAFVHPPTFEDLRVLCGILGINPVDLLLDCGFVTEAEVVDAAERLWERRKGPSLAYTGRGVS